MAGQSPMEIFKGLFSKPSGPEKPGELRETDAKLAELKSSVEKLQGEELDKLLVEKLKPSFLKDLADRGITDTAKQEELWGLEVQEVKTHLVLGSAEYMELAKFTDHEKNMGKLQEYANAGDPVSKLKKVIEGIPGIGWLLAGSLGTTFANMAKDSKSSILKPLWEKLALAFGKSEKANEKKEATELSEPLLGTIKKAFSDKGVNLYTDPDDKVLKSDFKWLTETAKMNIDANNIQELVDKTFVQNEKIKKLFDLANKTMDLGKHFGVRLEFLRFKDMASTADFDPINTLCAMLEGKDGTYELKPIDEHNIHLLLHDVVGKQDAKSVLDAKYKKKPEPQTVVAAK